MALVVLVNERHLMGEIPQEEFANVRSVPESFHLTLEEFSQLHTGRKKNFCWLLVFLNLYNVEQEMFDTFFQSFLLFSAHLSVCVFDNANS